MYGLIFSSEYDLKRDNIKTFIKKYKRFKFKEDKNYFFYSSYDATWTAYAWTQIVTKNFLITIGLIIIKKMDQLQF